MVGIGGDPTGFKNKSAIVTAEEKVKFENQKGNQQKYNPNTTQRKWLNRYTIIYLIAFGLLTWWFISVFLKG